MQHACDCKDCKDKRDNLVRHFQNPFYKEAKDFWNATRAEQIEKGAEKYPEPFNPDSWTNEELAQHAMQENVDQAHYITGMRDRMRKQETILCKVRMLINAWAATEVTAEETFKEIIKTIDDFWRLQNGNQKG
jgi:hypothetical protein